MYWFQRNKLWPVGLDMRLTIFDSQWQEARGKRHESKFRNVYAKRKGKKRKKTNTVWFQRCLLFETAIQCNGLMANIRTHANYGIQSLQILHSLNSTTCIVLCAINLPLILSFLIIINFSLYRSIFMQIDLSKRWHIFRINDQNKLTFSPN